MWPASASTTIPSGIGPAEVTMTLLSEPSGFTETMRPPLASRKNKRGTTALRTDAGRFDLGVCVVIIFPFVCGFVFISMEFRLWPVFLLFNLCRTGISQPAQIVVPRALGVLDRQAAAHRSRQKRFQNPVPIGS